MEDAEFESNQGDRFFDLGLDQRICPLDSQQRIRLHPPMALQAEIYAEYCYTKGKDCSFS